MKTQGESYSWNFSQFSADPYSDQNKVCPDNTVVGVGDVAGVGVTQGWVVSRHYLQFILIVSGPGAAN